MQVKPVKLVKLMQLVVKLIEFMNSFSVGGLISQAASSGLTSSALVAGIAEENP